MAIRKSKERLKLEGMKIGKLKVLSYAGNDKTARSRFLCQCDCGNQVIVSSKKLTRKDVNPTYSCGCLKDRNSRLLRDEFPNITKEESQRIRNAWSGAKRFGAPEVDFISFAAHCFARCNYCLKDDPKSMGIDRIDSNLGYIEGNLATACKRCNQAKNNMSLREFILLIRSIYKNTASWDV